MLPSSLSAPPIAPVESALAAEHDVLAHLSHAINSDLDLRRVLQTVTDVGTQLSRAQFGAFFYNGTDELGQLYQLHVLSGAGLETFASMPVPRITPLFQPTFTGEATVRVADVRTDPRVSGLPTGHLPVRSYLATPVVSRTGDVIGALLFGHCEPDVFGESSERTIELVASQAAVAVENARLYAAEKVARRRAETHVRRMALLQSLTTGLGCELTAEGALRVVCDSLGAPMGAVRVGLFLREAAGYRTVAATSSDAAIGNPALARLDDDVPNPVADAVARREPIGIADAEEFARRYPALAELSPPGTGASLAVPLPAGGVVQGALTFAWPSGHVVEAADIEMLGVAAGQVAAAVERAGLFAAERAARQQLAENILAAHAVSRTLQRSLLPRELDDVEGLSIAARYLPGSVDAQVGGDWYDVVATEGAVSVVVGDVMGHSIAAAALMGQLRTGLRAYLSEGHRVDAALARANRLLEELDPHVLATVCIVQVDRTQGQLHVVRAGHPAPLLARAYGDTAEIDARVGPPLGALADVAWPVTTVPVGSGDRIVLYSDGLVEQRDEDISVGIDRVRKVLAASRGTSAEVTAEAILDRARDRVLTDDVALLVCDCLEIGAGDDATTLQVQPEPQMVGQARSYTRQVLARWGLSRFEDDASLIVSELLSNVQRHAGSVSTLELRRTVDGLRVSVTDRDSRHPRVVAGISATAAGGRGMKLVAAIASAWGVRPSGTGKTVWAELSDDAR